MTFAKQLIEALQNNKGRIFSRLSKAISVFYTNNKMNAKELREQEEILELKILAKELSKPLFTPQKINELRSLKEVEIFGTEDIHYGMKIDELIECLQAFKEKYRDEPNIVVKADISKSYYDEIDGCKLVLDGIKETDEDVKDRYKNIELRKRRENEEKYYKIS